MSEGDTPPTGQDDTRPANLPMLTPPPNAGLFLDIGPQGRGRIKRLKRGVGRLARRIQAAADVAQTEFGIDPDVEIIPVVILYRSGERDRATIPGRKS